MSEDTYVSGVFVLTPSESKRLIARAVANLPQVRSAFEKGTLIIATGSTNAYVAEELLGPVFDREEFITGRVIDGAFGAIGGKKRLPPFVISGGKISDVPWQDAVQQFGAGDVFIKGANAVDAEGLAGILIGHPAGGTIGAVIALLAARGCDLIMPVGLEKLVPSVLDAADAYLGTKRVKYTLDGYAVGFVPVVNAQVITEIQALQEMFDVTATHVASGGIAGSEGAVTLAVEGGDEDVKACMEFVRSIKGEPPVKRPS